MKFTSYIAKRYLISKSSNNAINIIAGISVVGVILGTVALSVVLAGFSGLKTFSLKFLNASDPDIRISTLKGKSFELREDLSELLANDNRLKSYSTSLEERAFFSYKNKQVVAYLKGVDEKFGETSDLSEKLIVGTWIDPKKNNQVVVGNSLSGRLALGILNYGSPLRIMVPKTGKGYITNVQKAFNAADTQAIGVFAASEEMDDNYIFTNLETIQTLLELDTNQISQIDIRLKDQDIESEVIATYSEFLGSEFKVENRRQLNAVFYRMINTENLVSYLIFTFIVVIALFNVIGAIIMMILDKRSNLKTLSAMGATLRDIKRIFIRQGFLLSQIGLYAGLVLSLVLIAIQKYFEPFMITPRIAYPVELRLENFLLVIVTISVLGYLAAKVAASRINQNLIDKA